MYLKITQRGTIIAATPKRQHIAPGTKLTKADCIEKFGGQHEVDRLVDQGYLVRMYDETDPDQHPLPPQIDQVQHAHPHPEDVDMGKGGKPMTTAPKGEGGPVTMPAVAVQPTVRTDTGPWNLDPALLADKDVNELNVMVSERTHESQPIAAFETTEEAIAWLSQDFTPEVAQVATG